MDKKNALVLGGGGSCGAYEIGVWQALRELEYPIDIVTGTSVGALNAAIIVQDDFDKALSVWSALNNEMVLTLTEEQKADFEHKSLQIYASEFIKNKGIAFEPLKNLLTQYIDTDVFFTNPRDFGIATVEMRGLKQVNVLKQTMKKELLIDYMLASAACFPAFKPYVINETEFIDGGYQNNLPVDIAIELGATNFIIVDLKTIGIVNSVAHKMIKSKDCIYITSSWDLGNFLHFNKDAAVRNIRLGYLDALKAFNKYDGILYTFNPNEFDQYEKQKREEMLSLLKIVKLNFETSKKFQTRVLRSALKGYKNLLLGSCEICAKIFDLDPLTIYSIKDFNKALRRKISKQRKINAVSTDTKPFNINNLKNTVKNINPQMVSVLIADFIKNETPENISRISYLSTLMPKEFISAFYIIISGL